MPRKRAVSAKLEDYLESILELGADKGAARVRDIAEQVGVHKSTVTAALKKLAGKELVVYRPYELVRLTARGREIASTVSERHGIIKRFLSDVLLIDEATAGENACRMEHVMDAAVLERLVLFARHVKKAESFLTRFGKTVARREKAGAKP